MNNAMEMRHITKVYPGVTANDDVSIWAPPGSVLCIVGENGAGKSTLMNILYGMERPTSGEIFLYGKKVAFASSRDAMRSRVGMVHQHFMLIHELSCLENIILGMEPHKGLVMDRKAARERVEELMKTYNMPLPLDTAAGELWVGVQQKVEIIKTLYRGAEIIILDEPTAVLTPQETEELFINIRTLAKDGKTIILITHKLDEVMEVATDIVVMRMGKLIATLKPCDTSIEDLAIHMVGQELPPIHERKSVTTQDALKVSGVTVMKANGIPALDKMSFTLKRGEILGFAGVSGNGQGELAQVVAGLLPAKEGTIALDGVDVTAHDRRQRSLDGISYIPEDRNTTGLCTSWSVENNAVAGYHRDPQFCKKLGVIDRKATAKIAQEMVKKFVIKTPDITTPVSTLSGGNMQKVVVARETTFGPKVIIAAEPSRGVDIGAINVIHNHLIDLRNGGTAVMLISSSLDEVFALSDRICVLFEGKITAMLNPAATTREEVGLYMSGAQKGRYDQ